MGCDHRRGRGVAVEVEMEVVIGAANLMISFVYRFR